MIFQKNLIASDKSGGTGSATRRHFPTMVPLLWHGFTDSKKNNETRRR
jgi:hypothetical protein